MTEGRPPIGPLPWSTPRGLAVSLVLGAAGLAGFLVGAVLDPARAYFSYLVAFEFATSIAVCSLLLVMIERLVSGVWFVTVRRPAEAVTAALPVLAVLFLPVAFGVRTLYPWTDLSALSDHARELVQRKTAYLNLPFFYVRAGFYFLAWIVLAERMRRWSLRQDVEPGERLSALQRRWSAGGAIVLAFTLTFAAFDWLMSLEPTWYSTIYGVQIFAGGMVGALSLLALLVAKDADHGPLAGAVTPEHSSAIGKMLFTFVIFWAYASFSQLLIIWIGNLPDEVTWYVPRINGSWLWVGLALAVGHFAVPFFLLLSYHRKRRIDALARLGLWLLAMHYLEAYWIVMPQLRPLDATPHLLDAAAAAMVIGFALAGSGWRTRTNAAMPVGDPELPASLEYSES